MAIRPGRTCSGNLRDGSPQLVDEGCSVILRLPATPATAASQVGISTPSRESAHLRVTTICFFWNVRNLGRPGNSGSHARSAKYPAATQTAASMILGSSGLASRYHPRMVSGSSGDSTAILWIKNAASSSGGPAIACAQSTRYSRPFLHRRLSDRASLWRSCGGAAVSSLLDTDLSKVHEYMHGSKHPGKDRTGGSFGFAGHNDPVQFRNIRIKRLDGGLKDSLKK